MWSSRTNPPNGRPGRRAVLFGLAAAPLAACGFQPLYAPGGALAKLRNRITYADPNTRDEFTLRTELQNRIGSGSDFRLTYVIRTDEADVGITPDQVITRIRITGSVEFVLRDIATDAVIDKATVEAVTSYGTTDTTASTAFARDAAFDRLMVMLVDQMIARLAINPAIPA